MKLLKKEDIQQDYALERKLQIDEGMNLAKKIDFLRKSYAEEEQKLKAFRDSSLKAIQAEIDPLILQKQQLEREVRLLESKL